MVAPVRVRTTSTAWGGVGGVGGRGGGQGHGTQSERSVDMQLCALHLLERKLRRGGKIQ